MTIFSAPPALERNVSRRALIAIGALLLALTSMRLAYAGLFELRTDEAYYWTWSKESVLSFLDHPPMIAWFIRAGTLIFGDTGLGVRFMGIVGMLVTQLLLADVVRRVTQDLRAMLVAVLLPEAALYYGLLTAKVAPDVAMIPFAVAMIWSLVRLVESDDNGWWLAAGLFGGLALLSKLTVVLLVPALLAFMLVPAWRMRWLRSRYPWLAVLIAFVVSSPVLIWNAGHDWASFKFQFIRAASDHEFSWRLLGDFIGLQFGQVGFIVLPVALVAVVVTAWRGYIRREPVAVLLSTAVLVPFGYLLWKSLTLRIGDTWPMFLWPPAFAAAAINVSMICRGDSSPGLLKSGVGWSYAAIASGIPLVVLVFLYCVASPWNLIGKNDPIGGEAGYAALADRAVLEMRKSGATWIATTDYRTYAMLRWHLRGRPVPVVQINERARFLGFRDPGLAAIKDHAGLYIAQTGDDNRALLASTSAVLEPLGVVETVFRGVVMKTYRIEKLTGWTPELNPPPGTPFYRWPNLAMGISETRLASR